MTLAANIDAEIEFLAAPTSWPDATARLEVFTRRYGFDNTAYLSLTSGGTENGLHVFVGTYSRAWITRYLQRGYAAIDPVLPMARKSRVPFQWADLRDGSPKIRAFFDDAREMGAGREGLSIPILGPNGDKAVFSVTSDLEEAEWRERCRQMQPFLQILGLEFHRGLGRLGDSDLHRDRFASLSPREREVLRWASGGKTTRETSVLLGLSEQTVQGYMRDAIRRLGCINKTHAVAEAVRQSLI